MADKASGSSIPGMAGCLLFLSACEASLSAGEASDQQTVVVGGVVRPLAVKASGGGIPTVAECPARAEVGQASVGCTINVGSSIPEMA